MQNIYEQRLEKKCYYQQRRKSRYNEYFKKAMEPVFVENWKKYLVRVKQLQKNLNALGPVPKKKQQLISTINYFVNVVNLVTEFYDKGLCHWATDDTVTALENFNAVISELTSRNGEVKQYQNYSKVGEKVSVNNLYFTYTSVDSETTNFPDFIVLRGTKKEVVHSAPLADWINNRVFSLDEFQLGLSQPALATSLEETILPILKEVIDAILA